MAQVDSAPQITGVYEKVQSLISEHISKLESDKIEESKRIMQEAEEAKIEKMSIEKEKASLNKDIESLESKKLSVSFEIEKLEDQKELKSSEIDGLNSELNKKKLEFDEFSAKSSNASSDLVKADKDVSVLMEQKGKVQSELNGLESQLAAKKLEVSSLSENKSKLQSEVNSLQEKFDGSSTLVDKLVLESKNLLKEIDSLGAEKEKASSDKNVAKSELEKFVLEAEQKKKEAIASVKVSQDELEVVKKNIALEKESLESDKLFIKKMDEINAQKTKAFANAKDKLKEIITKCTAELDADKSVEFKTFLTVIEKL